jgi:hypothetical protein
MDSEALSRRIGPFVGALCGLVQKTFAEGMRRTVVLLAMTEPARWYVSDAILAEYAVVLARPELKIRKGRRLQLLQSIKKSNPGGHSFALKPRHVGSGR